MNADKQPVAEATPRTDSVAYDSSKDIAERKDALIRLSRQLERELAVAHEALKVAKAKAASAWNEAIEAAEKEAYKLSFFRAAARIRALRRAD